MCSQVSLKDNPSAVVFQLNAHEINAQVTYTRPLDGNNHVLITLLLFALLSFISVFIL
jgi:hypothetical protein